MSSRTQNTWLGWAALALLWAGCHATSTPAPEEEDVDAAASAIKDAGDPPQPVDAAVSPDAKGMAPPDANFGPQAFCQPEAFRITARDGITDLPALNQRMPVDETNFQAPHGTSVEGTVQSKQLAKIIPFTVHVPAQYEAAETGTVGLMIFSPVYDDALVRRNFDRLIFGGEMPVVIAVFPSMDWASASNQDGSNVKTRAAFLADELYPQLKLLYPKLSNDARMHGVGGQSTAGALAFDFAWARPDFFSKVGSDSTSFAIFMNWLFPYDETIDDSHKTQLRVSNTVGQNDTGDWLATNKRVSTALLQKGYATRLLVIPKGTHSPGNWLPATLDTMRWLWRPEVCTVAP